MFNNKRIERIEERLRDLEAEISAKRTPYVKEYTLNGSIYNGSGSGGDGGGGSGGDGVDIGRLLNRGDL